MSTARALAHHNEAAEIDASQQRAIAARKASNNNRSAMESLAARLQVQPKVLQETLRSTAFAACKNNEEFVSLVVVANEYGLNPLLKELYAFPAKGGGIVPMVSVDGWIRIMNEHPQFDGIEFDYIVDENGKIDTIEAIIYRKDRSHPIKVMEHLDECKRNTDPWNKMPRRMLRNRALIQGARIAFGFSGIVSEGDEDVIDITPQQQSLPAKASLAEELDDEIPAFDGETGEVVEQEAEPEPDRDETTGMTEVDEETARQLDAGEDGVEEEPSQSEAAEQTAQDIDGPLEKGAEAPEEMENSAREFLNNIKADIAEAKTIKDLDQADKAWLNNRVLYDDETADHVDGLLREKRKEIRQKEQGGK